MLPWGGRPPGSNCAACLRELAGVVCHSWPIESPLQQISCVPHPLVHCGMGSLDQRMPVALRDKSTAILVHQQRVAVGSAASEDIVLVPLSYHGGELRGVVWVDAPGLGAVPTCLWLEHAVDEPLAGAIRLLPVGELMPVVFECAQATERRPGSRLEPLGWDDYYCWAGQWARPEVPVGRSGRTSSGGWLFPVGGQVRWGRADRC